MAGGSSTADTLLGFDAPLVNWTIDGSNSGKVSATDVATIAFSSFENLTGISNTASDAFTFGESGSLSGAVDGGAGTADSISVFESAGKYTTFNAATVDAFGTLSLNGKMIHYAGVDHQDFLGGDTANRVITGTIFDDTIVVEDNGDASDGMMQVRFVGRDFYDAATNTTSDAITFTDPADSLKIEGDAGTDSIEVKSLDSLFSGTLGIYGSVLDQFGVPVDDPFSPDHSSGYRSAA